MLAGLNCSPFEVDAVIDAAQEVCFPFLEQHGEALSRPGQVTLADVAKYAEDLRDLEVQFEDETDNLATSVESAAEDLRHVSLRPKKTNIRVKLEHLHDLRRPILGSPARVPLTIRGARLRRAASTSRSTFFQAHHSLSTDPISCLRFY